MPARGRAPRLDHVALTVAPAPDSSQTMGEEIGMLTRALGPGGPAVSALGLGCMGLSDRYDAPDRTGSIATIHAALDAGVNLLDTGDFYGLGDNELLLRDALRSRPRDAVVLSVKFGLLRDPRGDWVGVDGRPAAVKNALAHSLRRLGTDHVDIYRLARVDPAVPLEDTLGAVADMVAAGYVRHVGLADADVATLHRARAVHPICDVQLEYSLLSRGIEVALLPTARALGIAVTAHGVLARGLLSGRWSRERAVPDGEFRALGRRFAGADLDRDLARVDALQAVADARGSTLPALAFAWVLARGPDIVPLIGARRRDCLLDALAAVDVTLDAGDLARIERACLPPALAGSDARSASCDPSRRPPARP